MIDYDAKLQFFEIFCDKPECDITCYGNGTYMEGLERAKQQGWKNKKEQGAWANYCPLHAPVYTPKPQEETIEDPF